MPVSAIVDNFGYGVTVDEIVEQFEVQQNLTGRKVAVVVLASIPRLPRVSGRRRDDAPASRHCCPRGQWLHLTSPPTAA
jgi:hypothetical protein